MWSSILSRRVANSSRAFISSSPLTSSISRAPFISRSYAIASADKFRNVAIIAHVDHGKTSLVDQLLKQSGTSLATERVMDSNQLEKERGITILAKNTSITWKGVQINIVDTPGHGDFGGEVERVLGMVDGVCLLVDANEGPMTQTKFVLTKALQAGLKPLVVLNKMDRNAARADETETQLFDLFTALNATDEQLSYPTLYASAREGWAITAKDHERKDMVPLLDAILENVPAPKADADAPFSMLITTLESDQFLGRIVTGRILTGKVQPGTVLHVISREGNIIESAKVFKVVARRGTDRVPLPEGVAGDIIGISGFTKATATMTICAPEITTPLPANPIDPPVLSMMFSVNKGPFAGKEGTQVVGVKVKARLEKELESNVSMTMNPSNEDSFEVKGRGEMQMGILLENMRREGFEVCVSQPRILMRRNEEGGLMEPVEEVIIEVETEYSGWVIEKMSKRLGELLDMEHEGIKNRIRFYVPARGLLGFRADFMNETHGTGIINHTFHAYEPFKGALPDTEKGAIVSMADGTATAHALESIQARGTLFIGPGAKVYNGMVIGENSRGEDMDVNPVREKQLTNVRTVMKEDAVKIAPPRILTLEDALSTVKEDELVEITPRSIRLRKKELNSGVRRSMKKKSSSENFAVEN
eukprot:TRINITY_DN889_c0_g1_i1.p1 TRINITY_DN889_c0_g1~~TRINITY_DN889_c0_g1_i1.p1  ORF type:complete len:649 (+),score=190.99 TRINITY_DN889_c0_g1_i1:252-2198(+)